jgi:hypothetical protein
MNPYKGLPEHNWWRHAVEGRSRNDLIGLYRKRFPVLRDDKIATAGSCFAQHITKRLRANGFNVLDVEPPPPGISEQIAQKFGYRIYSARYGNIYTARHLAQLAREAFKKFTPVDAVWERDGVYFDAMRPTAEPEGLSCPGEVLAMRAEHIRRVAAMLRKASLVVFTFGLTEAWRHKQSGTVYPMAPGVTAGEYDSAKHEFVNFTAQQVYDDFCDFRSIVKRRNPQCKFLVSVSPVPLIATASDQHILAATMQSKATLRTAARMLYETFTDIDYFPSYELISSPYFPSAFESDMRSVSDEGVNSAMAMFFSEHGGKDASKKAAAATVCDEKLIEAFT